MSTKMDSSQALANRIRAQRENNGWTLADLGERSGVSRAMISKIERGESSPTAAVLVRLASAFNLTLAQLLDSPTEKVSPVARAAEQREWTDPASGYRRRQVFQRADHPVELVEVEMPAGARVALPAGAYHRIRQLLWVLEGRMVIEEGAIRHELSEGDCLGFGPPADTIFANESEKLCRYVVALARQ